METDSDLTDLDELEQTPSKASNTSEATYYKLQDTLKPPHLAQYSAGSLYEWIHAGMIDLEPPYQREVVWGDAKQIKLIDSLLRNFYVPPIIFRVVEDKDGLERRVCIDGKQRLTSIQRFMDGLIPHQDPITKKKYWFKLDKQAQGRQKRELLPKVLRTHLTMKQLACIDYRGIEGHHERDIFQRVQLGMPLQPAERMASVAGPWPNFINEIKEKYMKQGQSNNLCAGITFDVARGKDFLAVTQVIIGVYNLPERTNFGSVAVEKWLTREDPPTPTFKKEITRVFTTYQKLISSDEYKRTVMQTRIAPVEFVVIALLVALHTDESLAGLARLVQSLRKDLRAAHIDIRTNNKVLNTAYTLLDKMGSGLSGRGKGKSKQAGSSSKRKVDSDSSEEHRPPPMKKSTTHTISTRARAAMSTATSTPIKQSPSKPPPFSSTPAQSSSRHHSSAVVGQSAPTQRQYVGELKDGLDMLRKYKDQTREQNTAPSQSPAPWQQPPTPVVFGGTGPVPPPVPYMSTVPAPNAPNASNPFGDVEQWFSSTADQA